MNVINSRTPLGGAIYPFLDRLKRRWTILSRDVTEPDVPRSQPPTLRWINDGDVHDLYVEGMDTQQFLDAAGLELSLDRGGYVLSKRVSRLMRPYFTSAFFDHDDLTIRYLDQNARERKIWDGAAQVSRALLLRLLDHLPEDISPRKRRQLEYELRCARRVEFTLLTEHGQDKGHAVVIDDLDVDFVLPRDTKPQVRLTDGTVFVGIVPVHSSDDMRLDIQSLINLYPFFDIPQLEEWLAAEGRLFVESVRSGDIARAMTRIDADTSLADVESWYVREYYLSGGHPMWFGSIVKATINQHLKRLHHKTLAKLRLPVPGGRYYVMADAVGGRGIPRGEIAHDPQTATAWVNHDDWCDFIADVLGGADQDDALWCVPFTDFDDERRILCWRSPNQPGEYIVLKPAADCHTIAWATSGEPISYPDADSRQLPPRIDTLTVDYLNLIHEESTDENQPYSIAAMDATIAQAQINKGVLGQYCNVLMLAQALYGRLPAHPPAALEQVIDASVKTGADLSPVREWCYAACEAILKSRKPIPALLQDRLSTRDESPTPVTSAGHWIDDLATMIARHIATITAQRDDLMRQTMPPLALFQHAFDQPDMLKLGSRFNQVYTSALPWTRGSYERARRRSQAFLDRHPPDEQAAILRGALAHYYLGQHSGTDGAAWQLGEQTDNGREPGIAHLTLRALREIGLLDELAELPDYGVVTYPGARVLETATRQVTLVGVWFNYLRAVHTAQGQTPPERLGDVSKEDVQWAKTQVARLARTHFRDLTLTIRREGSRKLAYTPRGNLFGYVAKGDEDNVGDCLKVRFCIAQDGDLQCIAA